MKTLKWIAVLPSSIIALFLANIVYRIGHYLTASRVLPPDSWSNIILVSILSSMFSSAIFVYVGTYIAPSYKKETALVLTVLICIVGGASLFIVNFISIEYISNIGIIAGIVGAVLSYIGILQSETFEDEKVK